MIVRQRVGKFKPLVDRVYEVPADHDCGERCFGDDVRAMSDAELAADVDALKLRLLLAGRKARPCWWLEQRAGVLTAELGRRG